MPRWTPESRSKQAAAIHEWKPWNGSTGPKTPAGKAKTSRNADKGSTARRQDSRLRVAFIKYCLRQVDLLECEERDFMRAQRTGRFDLWSKKHGQSLCP